MAEKPTLSLTGKLFIALFVSYAVLFVAALWTGGLEGALFWKVTVTYVVVAVAIALVYLVRREFLDDEQMKKDKYMD